MSEQKRVIGSADSLAVAARAAGGDEKKRGLPPVHLWNPPFTGDIDIRIARDGTWYHEGGLIRRHGLVKLFSSILRREGDEFFLVTPVEKVRIVVEDAPFVATGFEVEGEGEAQVLTFETQVGDLAVAGPDRPIRLQLDEATGEPSPYVMVRAGLEALIDRKSFYRLVDLAVEHMVDGVPWLGVWSGGTFFPLISADEANL